MSLEEYCDARLVILHPEASAYEAARALANNHVGAVVVQEAGRVVGIVTDRDLAVRALGFEPDPRGVRLRDIMTPEPVTLRREDSEQQALELMRERRVRRIPIVDDGAAVGMVTLDDLVLAGVADVTAIGRVVEAQLAQPAPAKPGGAVRPERVVSGPGGRIDRAARHEARAEQTIHELASRLQRALGTPDPAFALTAFEVVVSGLLRRITPDEAKDLAAQLPAALREKLAGLPGGPDREVTRASIERELARRLSLDRERAAALSRHVAAALSSVVSAGEIRDVMSQLPSDLRELFASAPTRAA